MSTEETTPKEEQKQILTEEQKELIKVANYLQKHGLKEREAVVNRQRVFYFRADKFHELVLKYKDDILKMLSKHVKFDELSSTDDSQRLGDIIINNGLMKWYDRVQDDNKKYKYPKKLVEVKNSMHTKGFYSWDLPPKSQTKMAVLALGLAIAVIAIILFPLWPYSVKLAIFNVLFYFSASIIIMVIIRLIIYIVLFPFGIDFWIFPNLFDDDAGIIDSFVPLLLINRREDGWGLFLVRILMILGAGMYLYTHSGLPLPFEEINETFNEIFEWGKDKMVGNETTSLQYTGKGSHHTLDDILKMTEEYEREEQEERQRKEREERDRRDQEEQEEGEEVTHDERENDEDL